MALHARLELRQGQSLVITPQLQQAIKLLQLSNIELDAFVDAELEKNPLLQRDESDSAPDANAVGGDEPITPEFEIASDRMGEAQAASDMDVRHDDLYADASPGDRAMGDAGDAPEMAQELELPRSQGGAVITRVERNSPASNAGLAPNDVILEVNRQPVTSVAQVTRELQRVASGDTVFLLVWRGGSQVFVPMTKR